MPVLASTSESGGSALCHRRPFHTLDSMTIANVPRIGKETKSYVAAPAEHVLKNAPPVFVAHAQSAGDRKHDTNHHCRLN